MIEKNELHHDVALFELYSSMMMKKNLLQVALTDLVRFYQDCITDSDYSVAVKIRTKHYFEIAAKLEQLAAVAFAAAAV